MSYISFYRKYRPQTFEEVVGQEHITRTLQNAISRDRLVHAYLFSGPRGTGKTTCARILAKCLNCEMGMSPTPCNKCSMCKRITDGYALDVIEIDAASNRGIDEIRDLREKVKFAPTEGRYKVYIIDEAHQITDPAFNAFLKTLEEPPAHAIFIMATTEPHKFPATILSRCQRFDFKKISVFDIAERLKFVCQRENILINEDSVLFIAKNTDGSLRDSLSVLDQVVSYGGKKIGLDDVIVVLDMVEQATLLNLIYLIIERNIGKSLELIDTLVNEGKSLKTFTKSLIEYFRNILIFKVSQNVDKILILTDSQRKSLDELSKNFSKEEVLNIINIFSDVFEESRYEENIRLLFEVALIKLLSGPREQDKDEKVKIESEKSKIENKFSYTKSDKKIDIENIKNNWGNILKNIKEIKTALYPLLCEGKPQSMKGNKLIIGFKGRNSFHKNYLKSNENRQIIKNVLNKFFGEDIDFECEILEDTVNKKEDVIESIQKIFEGSKVIKTKGVEDEF